MTPTSPMPDFRLTEEEIAALTLCALSLTTEPVAAYHESVPMIPSAAEGRRLIARADCVHSHAIQGAGVRLACDLSGVATRRSARSIERQLEAPEPVGARAPMPAFGFSGPACRAVRAFPDAARRVLVRDAPSLAGGAETLVEASRRRRLHFGCVGCHGVELKGA